MRKTATLIAVCLAAAWAIALAIGCDNLQDGDEKKTESTPAAALTIVNASSYTLYDIEWNGTAISFGGEIVPSGSQRAFVTSGKAYIYFSFCPKNGGAKIRCHTDSEIGIASGGAASFTFTDETKVVQSDYEKNGASLSKISLKYPTPPTPTDPTENVVDGLVIENGVVKECRHLRNDVVIPYGVTSIGRYAFNKCTHLKSVTIPDSVIYIEDSAFSECSGLTSVTIPDGVTSIGYGAFSECDNLKSVTISGSVTHIGASAFYRCDGLKDVLYNGDVADWCKIAFDINFFNGFDSNGCNPINYANNLYINGESVTDLIIPDGVTSIENGVFQGFRNLRSVTIPDSVTSIGACAFYSSGLESVTIPDSVTSIGDSAFSGCRALTSVTMPASAISQVIVSRKSSLQTVVITSGDSIESEAFKFFEALTSVTIPASVTSIGENAFYGCDGLKDVYYNGDVADWCKIRFDSYDSNPMGVSKNRANLHINDKLVTGKLVIPDGVTDIGEYAFEGCKDLSSVTIPDSVTSIGKWAFYECTHLKSITIPDSVTSIGELAFYCNNSGSKTVYYGGSEDDWNKIELGNFAVSYSGYNFSGILDFLSYPIIYNSSGEE